MDIFRPYKCFITFACNFLKIFFKCFVLLGIWEIKLFIVQGMKDEIQFEKDGVVLPTNIRSGVFVNFAAYTTWIAATKVDIRRMSFMAQ